MRRISDADHGKLVREQIANPPPGESPLHCFMRHFWRTVEPREFIDGWHLHAKCEVLTHVHEGEIKKLVLNEPPGSCKSLLVNVFWPAFIWLEVDPIAAMAFASYDIGLVNRDAKRFMDLLTSPICLNAYPEFSINPDQAIQEFYNAKRGLRFGTTPGGKFTGRHFTGHVYDDLIKPASIVDGVAGEHQKSLKTASEWIKTTASNRAIDPENLWRVLIMQRLHESDPAGVLLSEGDWEHLCFPERYEPAATWIVGDLTSKYEQRTERGSVLWPQRRSERAVKEGEKNLGSAAQISAQNQQNPSPSSGGVIEKQRLHYYDRIPRLLDCRVITSCDLSFKGDSVEQSRCAWQLWAEDPSHYYYLVAAGADWLNYPKAKAQIRALKTEEFYSSSQTWIFEDKANGPALMAELQSELNLLPYQPGNADKVARMLPFVELVHTGRVLFPRAPWAEEVIDEIVKVPRGQHDDHWDCMSQGLSYLVHGATSYREAYEGWQKMRAELGG